MTAQTVQWPQDFASLTRQTIPLHVMDVLCREADAIAKCDNFWTFQVYEPGKGLAFHFDKDEHVMKERQQMLQPVLSSVLYLTGDSTNERLGPTAIIDQQYDAKEHRAVPESPSRTALIFPSKNNYVLFDGRLGHGVLGSSSQQPRMTMLINWWAEKPQDVNSIPDNVIQQFSLTSPKAIKNLTNQPDTYNSSVSRKAAADLPAQLQQASLGAAISSKSHDQSRTDLHRGKVDNQDTATSTLQSISATSESAGKVNADSSPQKSAATPSHSDSQQGNAQVHQTDDAAHDHGHVAEQPADAKPEQLKVPCISIAGWDEAPVAVDEVLQTYNLHLTGPQAIHAVAINHSGFELFPLDEENLQANAGNIVTAAAFVPVGVISDDSDSVSHSDGSK